MRIRRIEVRDFRKLGHLTVEGLADGLNVLVGDNEAGKSTLLAAMRAVLFERHRVGGQTVLSMLPHGQDVRPEISLDFEIGGGAYRLRKAFNQRPEAELSGPALPRITGDAVEERLAELLGFQAPGNRGSKPNEHQGVYGLLWVDQGLAHASMNAGAGQGTLAGALETEVGQVLGGERGRHLLASAEKRRDTFWDKRDTPKPKGEFKVLQDKIADTTAQRDTLEDRVRVHDEKVVQLASKAEALARHARDDRMAGALRAREAARSAVTAATQLQATLDELSRARHRADLDRDAAAERVVARKTLISRAEAARARGALVETEASVTRSTLDHAERDARRATEHLIRSRAAREHADVHLAAIERALARRKAQDDLERVTRTLSEADAVAAKRTAAAAAARAITLSKKDLTDLDRLCAEREAARLKRDAASVQIALAPKAGATVTLDSVPFEASTMLLSRDAVLDLGGFGRLTVRPGGGITALADAVEAADRRVVDQLRALGQISRNDVANLLARKAEHEAEAAREERVFAVLAPGGLDAMRLEVESLRAAFGPDEEPDRAAPAPEEARAAAFRSRAESAAAEKVAEGDAIRTNAVREETSRQAAVLGERAAAAGREMESASSALDAARQTSADERLDALLAEAEQRRAAAAEAESAARTALDAADPETARLALRRAEGAEAAIRNDIDVLMRDKLILDVELRTLGQEGLGELLDEIEGQLASLKRELGAVSLEAQASLLLHRTLAGAQRESKDRWLGPVRDRVRPYLKLIQPDSEIVLNEKTFSIEHLVRGGVTEPFETLSVGAREQVAVITRLALADILRASGHPSAIILDDALVNTDEPRLDRMHLVLQKAAESLQVIVLTCRERDYYALGAPIWRL